MRANPPLNPTRGPLAAGPSCRRGFAVDVLFGSLFVFGCQELQSEPVVHDEVYVEYVSSVDFERFTSFAFVVAPPPDAEDDDEDPPDYVTINETRVREAVRREFAARGVVEDTVNPTLDIVIMTATQSSGDLSADCVPGFYWWGYTGGYNSCAIINISYEEIEIGTIVLGMGEAASGEVVFNAAMQGEANGVNTEERINEAVGEVFEYYPADLSSDGSTTSGASTTSGTDTTTSGSDTGS